MRKSTAPLPARLASFLQIRPGEGSRVGFVALLFVLVQASQGISANAADSLFLIRYGVDYLPFMFIVLGILALAFTLIYSSTLIRTPVLAFFTVLLFSFAGALLVERAALLSSAAAIYPILWLTVNIINSLLGVFIWFIAGEVLDTRQAKRLFPLFMSAGILGGILGNLITGYLARILETENLLILCAALLVGSWATMRRIVSHFWHPPVKRKTEKGFLSDIRMGYEFVKSSPLLQLSVVASLLFSILYFSVWFPFNRAASQAFTNEEQLAGFLGQVSGAAMIATLLVSLFIANRFYSRFGIVNAVLVMPLVYLGGFVLWSDSFTLSSAVVVRLAQLVVFGGITSSAWWALFNTVPPERRGQVLGFDADVQSAIGASVSGVLLLLGQRLLTDNQILLMGMLVAIAAALVVWHMRFAYGEALVHALRAGRFEVFSNPRSFAGIQGNASALRPVLRALRDIKPSTRRIAAEILGRVGDSSAVPALAVAAGDVDADVRLAALGALAELDGHVALEAIAARLMDPEPSVRVCALEVVGAHPGSVPPELLDRVRSRLDDDDVRVRAAAAMSLTKLGDPDLALGKLYSLTCEEDPEIRTCALDALAQIPGLDGNSAFPPLLQSAVAGTRDHLATVRAAACRALGAFHSSQALQVLAGELNDPDDSVRQAAAGSLRRQGEAANTYLLRALDSGEPRAVEAALEVLPPQEPKLYGPLSSFSRQEISRARGWQELGAALPASSPAGQLLREVVETRARESETRVIKALALLGHPSAMDLVVKSLKSRRDEHRAEAIEALETLGDRRLARQIIPLLDQAPGADIRLTSAEALSQLMAKPDRWTRALSARTAGDLRLGELAPNLRTMSSEDPDTLPRQAAAAALGQMGEQVAMDTTPTTTSLERMILLREVPLFAELSPDDLKQVADVTREEHYPDGATLIRQGEEGNELYVIVTGQVLVTKNEDGAERFLAHRGAGESIGEMAIIDSAPRSATVRAEGEVRALVLEAAAFKAILRDRPEVSLAVLRVLSRRVREH